MGLPLAFCDLLNDRFRPARQHLSPENLNLRPERLVLVHLAPKKIRGHRGLLRNARGGQEVHILELVTAVLKVLKLHQALRHQGLQAVVKPANTDPKLPSQVTLTDLGVCLQSTQNPVIRILLDKRLPAGTGAGGEGWH